MESRGVGRTSLRLDVWLLRFFVGRMNGSRYSKNRVHQRAGRSRRQSGPFSRGVLFFLSTFFWTSKRKWTRNSVLDTMIVYVLSFVLIQRKVPKEKSRLSEKMAGNFRLSWKQIKPPPDGVGDLFVRPLLGQL